jgi:hypothetical protein
MKCENRPKADSATLNPKDTARKGRPRGLVSLAAPFRHPIGGRVNRAMRDFLRRLGS